jgi:hypothetical protein
MQGSLRIFAVSGLHTSLLREMHLALLSEFGARAVYGDLARWLRDPELKRVLKGLSEESAEQVRSLSETMIALGGRPRSASARRRILAAALALSTPILGRRIVLRICASAADKASRWYAYFQIHLMQIGHGELAATCGRLSDVRRSHSQALETWVENA